MLVIVALTVLPFSNFRTHAHWAKVVWVPFGDAELRPLDMAANVLLFVPVGRWLPWPRHGTWRRRLVAAGLAAAVMSASVELFQVFCHNRTPSATDVSMNVAGALLGAWLRPGDRRRA